MRIARRIETQLFGLMLVILSLAVTLTLFGGKRSNGTSKFLNLDYLVGLATQTSVIAILAVGIVLVIITAGIDLSVGSIYALCGVFAALMLRTSAGLAVPFQIGLTITLCIGFGLICGLLNGLMVANLGVHPFIITLGTMMVYRGFAFIASKGQSVLALDGVNNFVKTSGLHLTNSRGGMDTIALVPLILTLIVGLLGSVYLRKTAAGRRLYAVGGNAEASRYSGLPIKPIVTGAYVLCGLTAGIAAFLSYGYYGAVSSNDGQSYELQAIAAAVIGGTSLTGGKGNALGAVLGALLIVMIRNGIILLGFDQNYERIIVGTAIVIAVVIDRLSAKAAEKRLLQKEI